MAQSWLLEWGIEYGTSDKDCRWGWTWHVTTHCAMGIISIHTDQHFWEWLSLWACPKCKVNSWSQSVYSKPCRGGQRQVRKCDKLRGYQEMCKQQSLWVYHCRQKVWHKFESESTNVCLNAPLEPERESVTRVERITSREAWTAVWTAECTTRDRKCWSISASLHCCDDLIDTKEIIRSLVTL